MVKLPAFFGKQKSINLLPRDSFESSTVGVILEWALAFGKWAVILTQLIVMIAFLWRFGLDRKLTNLRRSIEQEVAVIKSYEEIEERFLLLQKRSIYAGEVIEREEEVAELIRLLQSITPNDVWYERLSISQTSVSLTAYTSSLNGFARLLTAVQEEPKFLSINVGNIEDGNGRGAQLAFDLTLTFAEPKKGAK